ncbi:DUF6300 family protein [Nonomuraea ceibae]|uniref:DUF6300 family protein n=1 Tax=Nonomuraea ceibae TaxID=1935170 RepID=UPI001C5FB55A|nr:DUF6300 family protein [Nonomuraea ceibae]
MKRRIDVMTTQEPPLCPRCGAEGLLWARVPHGWANAAGGAVEGRTGVVLCAGCDADAPGAAPLITWFHVHGQAQEQDSEEFARLLVAWAEQVAVPPLDEQRLDTEIEMWRRGDL